MRSNTLVLSARQRTDHRRRAFGRLRGGAVFYAGVALVSVFVMISSFSSLNGSMLASPRVFFAMADDGMFFETIAR